MRSFRFILLFEFCIFFPVTGSSQRITGTVISIKDGDTIEILYKGRALKIRLYGIDCPEKGQDFGNIASQYTATHCFGNRVSIEVKGEDKFRRTLGIIFLSGERNLNKMLVENGLAWRYKYSRDKDLELLEGKAKENKKGLWSQKYPKAPWVFRSEKKHVKL